MVTLPPTFLFPLYFFTSPTTLYFTITIPSSFALFITWLFFFSFYLYTPTFTLPQTFPFPLYLFTSSTTLYFIVKLPSSFSLFYNLTLLLPILFVHIYGYTSSNLSFPSLPLYLPHYSLLHHNTSFILLVHTYGYTSSNLSLPSLPLYYPHYSLLHHYTSFIIFSFL